MAELHILGEITSGRNFNGHSFFVDYEIIAGTQWTHAAGSLKGSSHVMAWDFDGIIWSMPIDLHFATDSVQGWPKINIQVWEVDYYGRKDLSGYGVVFVPLPTGKMETCTVETWKPTYWDASGWKRMYQQARQMVMGGNPVLRDTSLVHNNDNRFKLHTTSGGTVTLKLTSIIKNSKAIGLSFAPGGR